MEQKVLAAILQSRKAWEYLKEELDPKDLSPEAEIIYGLVNEYYALDSNAGFCDSEVLRSRAERQLASNKIAGVVTSAIETLSKSDISATNIASEALAIKQGTLGNRIATALASGKVVASTKELMNEYLRLSDKGDVGEGSESEDTEFVGTTASELTKTSFTSEGLIQLYPLVLNTQIDGGLRGGHHVLVFAPTEMGKSLFVINACYGFLRQGLKVLYIGNEDPAPDILMRMMSRLTGMTKYEIIEKPDHCDSLLTKRKWSNFVFASLSPGSFATVAKLVEKHRPSVVVLDQLRNMAVGVDQRTQALEKAATEARNLAKRTGCVVISVTQAADSATGKLILDRGDVDGSNVGIPGQIDLMIGIGATPEMEDRNMRMLSFPKNKLSGIHTPISVTIDPFLSRVLEAT